MVDLNLSADHPEPPNVPASTASLTPSSPSNSWTPASRPWAPSDNDIFGADQNLAPKLSAPFHPVPAFRAVYPPFLGMHMLDQHPTSFLGHLTSQAMTTSEINEVILVHERLRPVSYTEDPVRKAWVAKFMERRKVHPDAEYQAWKNDWRNLWGQGMEEDPGDRDWSGQDRAEWMRGKEEREIEELAAQYRARIAAAREVQRRQDREMFVQQLPMTLAVEDVASEAEVEMAVWLAELPGSVEVEDGDGELEEHAEQTAEQTDQWEDYFPDLVSDLEPGGYRDEEDGDGDNYQGGDGGKGKDDDDDSTSGDSTSSTDTETDAEDDTEDNRLIIRRLLNTRHASYVDLGAILAGTSTESLPEGVFSFSTSQSTEAGLSRDLMNENDFGLDETERILIARRGWPRKEKGYAMEWNLD